jgi:hypothetical protein
MATSGTTAFDLDIDEIIQEGYERCGITTNSGYDLRSARSTCVRTSRILNCFKC